MKRARSFWLLLTIAVVATACGASDGDSRSGLDPNAIGPLVAEVGSVPTFEWTPIDGAAVYRLAVVGSAGPIWAWEGSATSVNLGGLKGDRPKEMPGPVVLAGTSSSVVALGDSGEVLEIIGPIEISPPGASPDQPATPTRGSEERVAEDLPDPCALVEQEDVDLLFGGSAPDGQTTLVTGPGGVPGGRSCSWSRGFAGARVSIFTRPSFLTPTNICDYCEPVDGLGDEAWGGVSELGSGGALLAISTDGLGVQVSADGLGASVEQLAPLAQSVLAGLG
jgi:hypothetical protein